MVGQTLSHYRILEQIGAAAWVLFTVPATSAWNATSLSRSCPWSRWRMLARLGLARAYALSGDAAEAKTAYRDFFTLWKDADPDIPILIEVKAEYAKLQ
jgi:hypothetical protein